MENNVNISLEFTPNPNTLKFVVSHDLVPTSAVNFTESAHAEKSPLAKRLFEVQGVAAVMLGKNFVTVTKGENGVWDVIHKGSLEVLQSHFNDNLPILDPDFKLPEPTQSSGSAEEEKIRQILDQEIRPAVAMDGGDIIFKKFENGIVYLHLQGSCHGCPSSLMTLKMGIENRLRETIPDIREVVAI